MRHAVSSERGAPRATVIARLRQRRRFGGAPLEAVIRAIARERFALCDQVEEEAVRVLNRRFGRKQSGFAPTWPFTWLDALRVELEGTVTGICPDPGDKPILECAGRGYVEAG
jgi:hypothetical protein